MSLEIDFGDADLINQEKILERPSDWSLCTMTGSDTLNTSAGSIFLVGASVAAANRARLAPSLWSCAGGTPGDSH